jgi:hypothetical protein
MIFIFFNILIQFLLLHYNIFNINLIIFVFINLIKFFYLTLCDNIKLEYELKPLLLILQQLDDNNQLKLLLKLNNKYNYISSIYPIRKRDNIDIIIINYLDELNN